MLILHALVYDFLLVLIHFLPFLIAFFAFLDKKRADIFHLFPSNLSPFCASVFISFFLFFSKWKLLPKQQRLTWKIWSCENEISRKMNCKQFVVLIGCTSISNSWSKMKNARFRFAYNFLPLNIIRCRTCVGISKYILVIRLLPKIMKNCRCIVNYSGYERLRKETKWNICSTFLALTTHCE